MFRTKDTLAPVPVPLVYSPSEAVALSEVRHPDLVLIDTHLRGNLGIPAFDQQHRSVSIYRLAHGH